MNYFQLALFPLLSSRKSLHSKKRKTAAKPRFLSRVKAGLSPSPKTSKNLPIESDLILQNIWFKLRIDFFPSRGDLDDYTLQWSKRQQKRTLASCNLDQRRVLVARELRHSDHVQWLEPLLYHEMCHAVLGKDIMTKDGKRAWHGNKFKALERKHPGIKYLDEWIKAGGWARAVRADRARASHRKRHKTGYTQLVLK